MQGRVGDGRKKKSVEGKGRDGGEAGGEEEDGQGEDD